MKWEKIFNRYVILICIFTMMFFVLVIKLFSLQIVHGEEYRKKTNIRMLREVKLEAPRGEILDRYGRILADNEPSFALTIDPNVTGNGFSNPEFHKRILRLLDILEKQGEKVIDNFPITSSPHEFKFNLYYSEEDMEQREIEMNAKILRWQKDHEIENKDYNAEQSYAFLRDERFKISSHYSDEDVRRLLVVLDKLYRENYLNMPVEISIGLKDTTIAIVSEYQNRFPGVSVIEKQIRRYPKGPLFAHIIGYTGKIDKEQYDKLSKENSQYGQNDEVGKMGIENSKELDLKGENGQRYIETSEKGKSVEVLSQKDPVPGNKLFLTIDENLQSVAEQSLIKTMERIRTGDLKDYKTASRKGETNSGSVVVLDVNTGAVLALVSYPSFEPILFQKGISAEDWTALREDPKHPMYPRAVAAATAPGSTFKALTGLAGLELGVINDDTPFYSVGIHSVTKIPDWKKGGHGRVNIYSAMEQSVNSYFADIAYKIGINNLVKYAKEFGFGELTGIELESEIKGSIASPEQKKAVTEGMQKNLEKQIGVLTEEQKRFYEEEKIWRLGNTGQAAIGQSYHTVTPLQLASFYAQIANGGIRYKVHIIDKMEDVNGNVVYESEPEILSKASVSQKNLNIIQKSLLQVTQGNQGTGKAMFIGAPVLVAGKTGTAEREGYKSHAWFSGFAPFENPQIAIAVNIEYGDHGGNAAYVARDIIDAYFKSLDEITVPVNFDNELVP